MISRFKFISCTEFNSFFIKDINNNRVIYSISISFTDSQNIISITDIYSGEFAKIKLISEDVVFVINYISKKIFDNIKVCDKTNGFNIEHFLNLFTSTIKEREKVKGTIKKVDIFRFETINKLKHQGFLCNNVPGFYPETKFFLLQDGRIKDSRTDNKILFEQEQKIWDFSYKNQDRVGKEVSPTVYDYCANRKIDISINGLNEKAIITYINNLNNGLYQIKINYQGKFIILDRFFSKEELIDRVIKSR